MDHGISNEEKATSSLGGEDKRTVTIIREEVYLAMRRDLGRIRGPSCRPSDERSRRNRSWV
jgi:hypothetical protein